jgi:hypothetical protein
MKVFDAGQQAVGVIAIGQFATGVIAIGQVATGVVAIGQVARGFVAVGQLAVGVWSLGMGSLGAVSTIGMLGIGGRARGLLALSLVPRRKKREDPDAPVPVTLGDIEAGAVANGWIPTRVVRGPDGAPALVYEGQPLAVLWEGTTFKVAQGILDNPNDPTRPVFAQLEVRTRPAAGDDGGYRDAARMEAVLVCTAMREPPRPLPPPGPVNIAFRVVGMIAVLAAVWLGALAPVVDFLTTEASAWVPTEISSRGE